MATLQQTVTAQRFSNALRAAVDTLKSQSNGLAKIVTFWNGLSDVAKNQLCTIEDLDRAEIDSVVATLDSTNTALSGLPTVTSTF